MTMKTMTMMMIRMTMTMRTNILILFAGGTLHIMPSWRRLFGVESGCGRGSTSSDTGSSAGTTRNSTRRSSPPEKSQTTCRVN